MNKISSSLTERQRAVVAHVCEGWTNAQVARHLQCTEGAIKATLQQIFKKLGVRKRSQVIRLVLEQKVLDHHAGKATSRWQTNRVPGMFVRSPLKDRKGHHAGDFVIDVALHRVWVRGVETHLTPSEFALLEVFGANPGAL